MRKRWKIVARIFSDEKNEDGVYPYEVQTFDHILATSVEYAIYAFSCDRAENGRHRWWIESIELISP